MEKEKAASEKSSEKSAGPYTPLRSPVDIGNMSPSEWQWQHSSASPVNDGEAKEDE